MATKELPRIAVEIRTELGSRHAARVRDAGRLPAVIYGHKQDPIHVSFDQKQFTDVLHQQAHLIEVVIDSTAESCLIKQVQWNHLGSQIQHVDLTRVDLKEHVTISVQLQLTGDAVGLKEAGSLLEHPLKEVDVECEAANIPASLRVDVGNLGVGQSITVGDIQLAEGIVMVTDLDTVIASIRVLAEEAEEEPPEAAEGEPEVIGKEVEEKQGKDG